MNFEKVTEELKTLQEQIESSKVDTKFEKNKLRDYLGESLYNTFKRRNVIVAGGMITSLFTGKDINDVDVYFRSKEDLAAFISELYGNYIASHTKKATMFIVRNKKNEENINIQAIHFKYFETPQEIFNTFDFTHVMGAYDFSTEEFILHRDFLKHNAQRILKFNKSTAYPLISLIRSNKYMDRGYSISKPELMRIVMTCMKLKINSYEELKEHLGGMYGESYDKAFEGIKDEDFSLDEAIDRLKDLALSENYFKKPEPVNFNTKDDLIYSITGLPVRWFEHNGLRYEVSYSGNVNRLYNNGDLPDKYKEIDAKELLDIGKVYKFVKKSNDTYISYFDKNFRYNIGEIVEAKGNRGLFFNKFDEIHRSTYLDKSDKVLIEAEVKYDDLLSFDSHLEYSKAKILREVPKEEWEDF